MLGLVNDTQDMEFLHTWVLLPQSTYPIDLRGDTVAHLGVDLYGNLAPKKLGSFSYTLYGGKRPDDPTGGYVYSLDKGVTGNAAREIDSYGGPIYGADLRSKGISSMARPPATLSAVSIPRIIPPAYDRT
jgi:hypothetical protein